MWVKKEFTEIVKEENKKKIRTSLYAALISFLYNIVEIKFEYNSHTSGPSNTIWNEYFYQIPKILLISGLVFMIVYALYPNLKNLFQRRKPMICPECDKTKDDDGQLSCECGGVFYEIKNMKWVEED